jgi:nucleoid-associated protein EbfC
MQPGGDMSALLAQAQQMQQKLLEAQQQLANSEVHGKAGGGLVEVVVKGSGEVVAVKIDPQVVDPEDIETLQDLIVGAMADASKQVTQMAQEQLGSLAGMGGIGGPPGQPPAPPTQMPGL